MTQNILRPLFIRQAAPAERGMLRHINLAAYTGFEDVLSQEHWATMKRNMEDEAAFDHLLECALPFVAELDRRIVAAVYLMPSGNPTDIFPAEWSYIRLLGVLPECRGLGIGRALTERCIHEARSRGEPVIALHTSEFQPAARHIYESMGFTVFKELDLIFHRRYWLYTMNL